MIKTYQLVEQMNS